MQTKNFEKKDEGFTCSFCKKFVPPLNYTSRDHCPFCLKSLHVDNNPGDRSCTCLGEMMPVSVEYNNKKGYVITYKCKKCGYIHKNKTATDDNFEEILKIVKK